MSPLISYFVRQTTDSFGSPSVRYFASICTYFVSDLLYCFVKLVQKSDNDDDDYRDIECVKNEQTNIGAA